MILAAVGPGAEGDEAIRHADRHARAQAGRLTIARVIEGDDDPGGVARALVEQVRRVTGRAEPDFDAEVFNGKLADTLVREADARAAVLVVAHVSAADPGSIDDVRRIARDARASVLVVRPQRGLRVLAATDLAASSAAVLAVAAAEARRRSVPLTALHCIEHRGIEGAPVRLPPELAEVIERARLELATATRAVAHDAELSVVVGAPASAIIRAIDGVGADLVVVSTRGASGLERLLFGSVADAVLRAAPCSVYVVRS
ncbi:MAG: universal stress protein [Kofleriaceae bacterium]